MSRLLRQNLCLPKVPLSAVRMARSSRCCFTVGPSISPSYIRSQLISWTDSEDYAFLLGLLYSVHRVSPHHGISRTVEFPSSAAVISEFIRSYAEDAQGGSATVSTVPSAEAGACVPLTKALEAMSSAQAPAATKGIAGSQNLLETAADVALRNAASTADLRHAAVVADGFREDPLSDCAGTTGSLFPDTLFPQSYTISPGGDTLSRERAEEERENALLVLQGVENWLLADMYISEDEAEHAQQKQELQLKFLQSLGYDVTDLRYIEELARVDANAAETEQLVVPADFNDNTTKAAADSGAPTASECVKKRSSLSSSMDEQGEHLPQKKKESQGLILKGTKTTRQRATLSQSASTPSIAKKGEGVSPVIASRYGFALRRDSFTARRKQGRRNWRPSASSASRGGVHKSSKGETIRSRRRCISADKSSRHTSVSVRCSSRRSSTSDNTSDSVHTSSRRTSVTTRSSSRRSSTSDNPSSDADMFVVVPV